VRDKRADEIIRERERIVEEMEYKMQKGQ
jgi:hypothetical protein